MRLCKTISNIWLTKESRLFTSYYTIVLYLVSNLWTTLNSWWHWDLIGTCTYSYIWLYLTKMQWPIDRTIQMAVTFDAQIFPDGSGAGEWRLFLSSTCFYINTYHTLYIPSRLDIYPSSSPSGWLRDCMILCLPGAFFFFFCLVSCVAVEHIRQL